MSIVKVTEVIAQSDKGFDDAVRVESLSAKVDGDRIKNCRANCKVSFVVKERS